MQTADHILLERWYAQGDATAFREITRRYANLVFAAALRVLKNASDAEDVAQECFEALALRCESAPTYLGAWLHTAATNRAITLLRSAQRRQAREERVAAEMPESTRAQWDDLYEHVDAAIATLPEECRAVLVGHFLEGQSKAGLARALGLSRPAIHYRIDKGLEQVRGALRRRGVVASGAALSAALAEQSAVAAPASLGAALGKIAVAAMGTAASAAPVLGTTIAGSIVMKKAIVLVLAAIAVAGGIGVAVHRQGSPPPSPTPAPVPSTAERQAPAAPRSTDATVPTPPPVRPASTPAAAPAATPEEPAETPPDFSDAGLGDLVIAGRVVDRGQKPIKGVFIQIFGQGSPFVHSGEDGRFRITGLAPGLYSAQIQHEQYSSPRVPSLEAGNEEVLIVMEGRATVSGRVVDARTKLAVPRFSIYAQAGVTGKVEPGFAQRVQKVDDARGQFELAAVEIGDATIIVQAEGYSAAFTPLHLDSSAPVKDITIALRPGAVVEGIVEDGEGEPVPGAWVFTQIPPPAAELKRALSRGREEEVRKSLAGLVAGVSAKDGTFRMDTLRGDEAALFAFHPKDGSGETALSWNGDAPLRGVTITLEHAVGTVEVLVTVNGDPAADSKVFATATGGLGESLQQGFTGADGKAVLKDLPVGVFGITAMYPGQQQQFMRRMTADVMVEKGATTPVTLDFADISASLEGQVRLGEEIPLNGNLMLRITQGDRAETYMSNYQSDGAFRFDAVIAGEGTLNINAMFGEAWRSKAVDVTVVGGENPFLDIDLAGGGAIAGVLAGLPAAIHGNVMALRGAHVISEVSLAVLGELSPMTEGSVLAEADGSYSIEGLAPGHYTVLALTMKTLGPEAFRDGVRFAVTEVDIVDGETATVDFDMGK